MHDNIVRDISWKELKKIIVSSFIYGI